MNLAFPPTTAPFVKCVDCHATLGRLIGNLGGFLYRRRHDRHWTMEFVSPRCRDITGYDPHRFIGNASIAYADLIAKPDLARVLERVRMAVQLRRSAVVEYRIRTACGAPVHVEDRFTPVVNASGQVLAIEGIVDKSRCRSRRGSIPPAFPDVAGLSALSPVACVN